MILLVAMTLSLSALAPAVNADSGTEAEFLSKINATRAAEGLGALQLDDALRSHARSHTDDMVATGQIFHSTEADLTTAAGTGWSGIAENVGKGKSPTSLHDAFMASPAHRMNTLGDYNYVGIGTDTSGGYLYVTVVFVGRDDGIASDTSEYNTFADSESKGSVGVVDISTGEWNLLDLAGNTTHFFYGTPGDLPFVGDWDCDGDETPGLYRQSDGFVYLRNSNLQGVANISFFVGDPADVPLAGDFDGDGCDTISIYRPSESRIYVINDLGVNGEGLGQADFSYIFGNPGDNPFVGDFDNDLVDEVGLHRESTGLVYFRNTHTQGNADSQFIFGDPGDKIVAAEWARRGAPGPETVGLFRPSTGNIFLRYTNSQGNANETLTYGVATALPVAGDFGVLTGGDTPPQPG
ncbi:MAG TPA: CAP domain-containing protein [Acidimicrobiia bacterium]|nr:CAP domain-containing protein [Acidimicrobiia bacterium]